MRCDPLYSKNNTGKPCPCLPGSVFGWFHFRVVPFSGCELVCVNGSLRATAPHSYVSRAHRLLHHILTSFSFPPCLWRPHSSRQPSHLFSAVPSEWKRSRNFSVGALLAPQGPAEASQSSAWNHWGASQFQTEQTPLCSVKVKSQLWKWSMTKKRCPYLPRGRCQKWHVIVFLRMMNENIEWNLSNNNATLFSITRDRESFKPDDVGAWNRGRKQPCWWIRTSCAEILCTFSHLIASKFLWGSIQATFS